jgi:hypothetical protein
MIIINVNIYESRLLCKRIKQPGYMNRCHYTDIFAQTSVRVQKYIIPKILIIPGIKKSSHNIYNSSDLYFSQFWIHWQ